MISAPIDDKNLDAIERLIAKEIPRADNPLKDAAPEETIEKPKRSRSRKPREDANQPEQSAEPKSENRNEPKRSRGGRDRDRGNKVVGMGDHMPSFIAMSFAERQT